MSDFLENVFEIYGNLFETASDDKKLFPVETGRAHVNSDIVDPQNCAVKKLPECDNLPLAFCDFRYSDRLKNRRN